VEIRTLSSFCRTHQPGFLSASLKPWIMNNLQSQFVWILICTLRSLKEIWILPVICDLSSGTLKKPVQVFIKFGHITTSWWSLQLLLGGTHGYLWRWGSNIQTSYEVIVTSLQTNDKAYLLHITIFRNSRILVIKICSVKTSNYFVPFWNEPDCCWERKHHGH